MSRAKAERRVIPVDKRSPAVQVNLRLPAAVERAAKDLAKEGGVDWRTWVEAGIAFLVQNRFSVEPAVFCGLSTASADVADVVRLGPCEAAA